MKIFTRTITYFFLQFQLMSSEIFNRHNFEKIVKKESPDIEQLFIYFDFEEEFYDTKCGEDVEKIEVSNDSSVLNVVIFVEKSQRYYIEEYIVNKILTKLFEIDGLTNVSKIYIWFTSPSEDREVEDDFQDETLFSNNVYELSKTVSKIQETATENRYKIFNAIINNDLEENDTLIFNLKALLFTTTKNYTKDFRENNLTEKRFKELDKIFNSINIRYHNWEGYHF